jgi:transposase
MTKSRDQRGTILELCKQGVSKRQIAKTLKIARGTVAKVIRLNTSEVPVSQRPEKLAQYHEEILRLHTSSKGNLVRVHEELEVLGAQISYPALTAYSRRHDIGQEPKKAVGEYHFGPGEEIQHDTSPHKIEIGRKLREVETASAVLCYSRTIFFQCYPTFNRFYCKVFLTDALRYFKGAGTRMMIDNTHVVVLRGTGVSMVPAPEMKVFADRYGFEFVAHEVNDPDRKARVERPFWYIERNFIPGRIFADWRDLNNQAAIWCDKVNSKHKRSLGAVPLELYALEKPYLRPLPIWVPDVYLMFQRTVDTRGYVCLHDNRYSVPESWIGREVEVRESKDQITIDNGPRQRVIHERLIDCRGKRITLKEHRRKRGRRQKEPSAAEQALLKTVPEISDYVSALKKRKARATSALQHLLRMVREYPREPLLSAVREAAHYGLYELDRVERMILRRIAGEYFLLHPDPRGDDNE